MNNEEIIAKIKAFLVEEFEVDDSKIIPTASLKETLDLDSLDYVDLVVLIDEHFGFKVTQEEFATMRTFQDFFDFIIARVQQA
jgi:acyl carrier protein